MRVLARQGGKSSPPAGRRRAGDGRLRVLFVQSATAPPLGADTWIHGEIMRELDRATHEVHVACVPWAAGAPTPTFQLVRDLPDVRVKPIDFGPERFARRGHSRIGTLAATAPAVPNALSLARYIRHERISVIHAGDRPRDALAAVVLGRAAGVPSLIQAHVGYGDWMNPALKWSLRNADALVGVSRWVADTLAGAGNDPARIHVVLNAIDAGAWEVDASRSEARQALGLPLDAPVVLSVCRLFPSKGPGDLIQAMAVVTRDHPRARLLVAGHEMVPGYAGELERQAAQLGLADRVSLLGRRDDVGRLMAAADVFAMPSVGEPFGLVYLEAMAMGLPVVALRSGGVPEVVGHDVTGLLSEPGDELGLARNVAALLADPQRRARMGAAGRQRVVDGFTPRRMAADMAAVYRAVTGGAAQPGHEERVERDVAVS